MHKFTSPWLAQLKEERPHFHINENTSCDVAIVGGGIAGMATAYHLLKNTQHSVLLIEAGRIAHGATGRNAGQVVSYFERSFESIVEAFGLEMAATAQNNIDAAWDILEGIVKKCGLSTPLHMCVGYAGFSKLDQILSHLEERALKDKAGIKLKPLLIKADPVLRQQIPEHLQKYILEVPHSIILKALETEDQTFIALEISKKGCMNSALFCEELAAWMTTVYPERFRIAEHLPVEVVQLEKNSATLKTASVTITAKKVVLCTNGFEHFTIENNSGDQIDKGFHIDIQGVVGYMAGYYDEAGQVPAAVSYYRPKLAKESYHYLTRRPYENSESSAYSLICIGGPERFLPDRATYDPTRPFPADVDEELDSELRNSYSDLPPAASRTFLWQGLMCYTPNKLRRIGYEPKNNVLLYNLGCNGVGILPSLYGGKRIAQLLSGIHLPPCIFDPANGHK